MGKRVLAWLMVFTLLMAVLPWTASAQQPTLRWGSRGASVSLAQRKLSAWGYYKGSIDGVYGRLMYGAVISFQRKNGLRPDGVVGPRTWAALGEQGATAGGGGGGGSRAASRADDRDLLARVISAEAKGEPYEGQVAVGAVILNRVSDSRFPNTLAGVVYQRHAFESVSNGAIYQPATASTIRAARDALNGWDPSGGAVFFWNPSKPVSGWIWSRPIIKRIGAHVFAK
ncbi:MAG: spore cortex-lytic enzyme precursor [Symbiobacteriaceae bacterium]|nr:spore cortex-lytic enzyme precursor [Symbiobacteriaceae bacterium]